MHAPTRAMRRAQNILCANPSNPGLPTNREHSKQLVNYAPRAMRGIFYARVNHVPDYQLIADTTNGSSIMRHAPYAMRHARNILCANPSCPGLWRDIDLFLYVERYRSVSGETACQLIDNHHTGQSGTTSNQKKQNPTKSPIIPSPPQPS